jgi:hypothetical protein
MSAQGVSTRSLIELSYELLDALHDTARLAASLDSDLEWAEHLDFLRRLQRHGRERLAHAAADAQEDLA